jgi:alpha-beta hydrolase superfamily lysophospholipase
VLDTLSAAGLTSVSSKFYDDARHELVHEKNRKDVIPHIVSWLTKHIT